MSYSIVWIFRLLQLAYHLGNDQKLLQAFALAGLCGKYNGQDAVKPVYCSRDTLFLMCFAMVNCPMVNCPRTETTGERPLELLHYQSTG